MFSSYKLTHMWLYYPLGTKSIIGSKFRSHKYTPDKQPIAPVLARKGFENLRLVYLEETYSNPHFSFLAFYFCRTLNT